MKLKNQIKHGNQNPVSKQPNHHPQVPSLVCVAAAANYSFISSTLLRVRGQKMFPENIQDVREGDNSGQGVILLDDPYIVDPVRQRLNHDRNQRALSMAHYCLLCSLLHHPN